jgi:hypothetical protein
MPKARQVRVMLTSKIGDYMQRGPRTHVSSS